MNAKVHLYNNFKKSPKSLLTARKFEATVIFRVEGKVQVMLSKQLHTEFHNVIVRLFIVCIAMATRSQARAKDLLC